MFFLGKFTICLSLCFAFVFAPFNAYGTTATDQIKGTVDKVLDILKNKELKLSLKVNERRALIRKAILESFNFDEMAKRSLGLHWDSRTPEQKKEFIILFTDLLERAYIKKIEKYTREKFIYTDENVDGDYSLVRSKIITTKNIEVSIEYKFFKKDNKWEVYDISINGVSLVNNYRTQFNKIIRTHSYEELIKKMKNKQEEEMFDDKMK